VERGKKAHHRQARAAIGFFEQGKAQALKAAECLLTHYLCSENPPLTPNGYLMCLELSHLTLAAALIQNLTPDYTWAIQSPEGTHE
jgi:hypothetical protein